MLDDSKSKNLCYHSHNFFCDGKNTIEELIHSSIKQNITHLGISSHAPLKISNPWSISYNELENYSREIDSLKEKYNGEISVFKSLEIDYIPEISYPFEHFSSLLNLDYTIGSIHLVHNPENNQLWFIDGNKDECHQNFQSIFKGDIQLAIKSYYRQIRAMIETQRPDIIGHLDKVVMNSANVFFDESEEWYTKEIEDTLKIIEKYNCIIEINTRGIYKNKWKTTFPSENILQRAKKLNIPIIISSDAHHTTELSGGYDQAKETAKACGYTKQAMFHNGKWTEVNL